MTSIQVSPKYGVNPMIPRCFFCGKDKNEILLLGKLKDDAEAPHGQIVDEVPCEQCADYMAQGVIFIEVRDNELDRKNPYRMGGWAVVREEAIPRMLDANSARDVLKSRVCFIEASAWEMLGIPRKEATTS